jgi:hypothetical protein
MIINGTFNINILRLPLLVAVGVSNKGISFPLTFNYTSFKSEEVFGFFIDLLKEVVFLKELKIVKGVNIKILKVVLSDQAAELIAVISYYLLTAQL